MYVSAGNISQVKTWVLNNFCLNFLLLNTETKGKCKQTIQRESRKFQA